MKRFLTLLAIALTSLSLFAATAEAKRFGGGSSFGKQRTMDTQPAPKAPAAAPAQGATPAPAAGNKWLGPLAGLAIGAGLFALLSSAGLDGALGGILMALLVAGVVMFLIAKFRRQPQQAAMQYAGAGGSYKEPQSAQQPAYGSGAAPAPALAASTNIPADFPMEAFLRSAKTTFIRLQAANDRKDLNDIREYTTPEMFAEISMQLQERGNAPQKTDVIAIAGDLLQVVNEGDLAIASVRFTGQLSENNGPAENVDEIWHVQKNLRDDKSVWLLAGIQQTTLH
ncbi:MAG: Tim44-like domain-containing protein [Gallionella sp.]|nr:Tim44-like domain-containing protein [Gallionella sp.]